LPNAGDTARRLHSRLREWSETPARPAVGTASCSHHVHDGTPQERERVVTRALDVLSHPQRAKLPAILRRRIDHGDYPDDDEQNLDEITYAVARVIYDELGDEPS